MGQYAPHQTWWASWGRRKMSWNDFGCFRPPMVSKWCVEYSLGPAWCSYDLENAGAIDNRSDCAGYAVISMAACVGISSAHRWGAGAVCESARPTDAIRFHCGQTYTKQQHTWVKTFLKELLHVYVPGIPYQSIQWAGDCVQFWISGSFQWNIRLIAICWRYYFSHWTNSLSNELGNFQNVHITKWNIQNLCASFENHHPNMKTWAWGTVKISMLRFRSFEVNTVNTCGWHGMRKGA